MVIEVTLITGPAYWASALVNGDTSGMDEEEITLMNAWLEHHKPWYIVDVARDLNGEGIEPRFTWFYSLYGGTAKGGVILDYVAYKHD